MFPYVSRMMFLFVSTQKQEALELIMLNNKMNPLLTTILISVA